MGEDISVSSGQLSYESPPQAEDFQGQSSPGGSGLAEEQLVSSPAGTPSPEEEVHQPEPLPTSPGQDCFRYILDHEQADFMGFLKFAALRRFNIEPQNVDSTEADKAESTIRQYDSAFRKFSTFVREHNPGEMSPNFIISFLSRARTAPFLEDFH